MKKEEIKEDKWKYTNNGRCWKCDRLLDDHPSCIKEELVTSCPYCNATFLD